jgi:ATP-dependent Clp protease adaptor protein ClpS
MNMPSAAPAEQTETRDEYAPLYQVIIHNDDVTPMDFVLHILTSIFELAGVHAVQVMFTAHHNGSAYVQTLPKDEAVRRVGRAHVSARLNGYPLTFTIEAEE